MGRIIPIIALSGLLAGCQTIAEMHNQADDAKCVSFGSAKGTQPYFDCRMALEKQRNQRIMALSSGGAVVVGQ